MPGPTLSGVQDSGSRQAAPQGLGFRPSGEGGGVLRGRDPDGDICQVPWALRGMQAAKETQLGFPFQVLS